MVTIEKSQRGPYIFFEGKICGVDKGSPVVKDDPEWDLGHPILESPLVGEGFHETSIFQLGQDLGRDPAAQVKLSSGKTGQGKVSGHCSQNGDKDIKGLLAEGLCLRQGGLGDDLGRVLPFYIPGYPFRFAGALEPLNQT